MNKLINFLASRMKGTHYVNFSSPSNSPIAFSVNSSESTLKEVRFKISFVLCFKFCGIYIPVQKVKNA